MKRAGFTMIELIFVIVILGILAAVAIPKLAATRTDAEIAKMATNAATIISDYGSAFTARGNLVTGTLWGDITNTPTSTDTSGATATSATDTLGTTVYLSDGTAACVTLVPSADGNTSTVFSNLTVSTTTTTPICTAVAAKVLNLTKLHEFGGTGVQ